MVWWITDSAHQKAIVEIQAQSSSERVTAVLGGALLDISLRMALEDRFKEKDGSTDMNEKLFKIGGPLGNFGPKVDLAYQLHMLDKLHRNAMHGIAEIRNHFAHDLNASFSDLPGKIVASINKLKLHEGRTHYPDPFLEFDLYEMEKIENNRDIFVANVKLCLVFLIVDHSKHHRNTNIPISYQETLYP